ncbi:tol-pal system protein YbgF [Legionella shakespearei]|uniref:Cell division coordinator CpoB n=1 Tax=Legionella shakespearei DSM 23087 TaxID=1122169 RepID=A0A0W0YL65_9GAMM|nr:tol-pal system protein YbgF [Legionella shakespearei]KTD57642.1 outer membrane protein [Legionella shakespearei DSM 23087]
MIHCKKTIIAACFSLLVPLTVWSEAPVIDDSDNFAIYDGQQVADEAPVVNPKYDQAQMEHAQLDGSQNDGYQSNNYPSDEGPALVKEDQGGSSANNINDSARLIDKIQSLQQEVQELRGQLEVQAHDLKLLQQQQVAFYKDLDARLGSSAQSAQAKPPTELNIGSKTVTSQTPKMVPPASNQPKMVKAPATQPVIAVSRVNPADEQISYLAAYELVKNKQYDEATTAMQTFVQKYPKGGYTANAEYWLGELYMVKRDYSQAIEHFEIVLQQFPSSSKAAACMLKSGYAYAATGNNEEARRRLQQVIRTYPNTPTAQLASSKLQTINT